MVDSRGGFATTRELHASGATDRMLTAAVRFGHLRRARNGWYSTADPRDPRFLAVRRGGRLTGISAFAQWGAWILTRPAVVHVAVPFGAARLRQVPGVRTHYQADWSGGSRTEVSVHHALVQLMLGHPADVAVPCIDWLLRSARADLIDVERCVLELPDRGRRIMRLVDRESQSVLESVARVRLIRAGFRVESQRRTGELGASDLVIEGEVALELDGREFHEHAFESDRRRDLVTTLEGKHVIRVSRRMLRERWPSIEAAIRAALAARSVGNSGTAWGAARIPRQTHRRATRAS